MGFLPKSPLCAGCPAEHIGRSYVPGCGNPDARVALIGQGPGEVEALTGKPFVGPSGQRLDRWLSQAGLSRSAWYTDNIVRCWLPGNRAPTKAEAANCWTTHTLPALRAMPNLEWVIPVGLPSASQILSTKATEMFAGTVHEVELG